MSRTRTRRFAMPLVCALLATAATNGSQPATQSSGDDAALRPYLAANGLLSRGMYDLAAAEYRSFLDKNPSHEHAPTARYGLAVAYFRGGDLGRAESELEQLHDRRGFEYGAEVSVMLAQCYLARGDHGSAADCLRNVPKAHPDHELADDAAALLVESLYRAGRLAESVTAADAIASAHADSPLRERADFFAGLALVSSGDDAGASQRFSDVLERSPKGELADRATLLLARSAARMGDTKRAESLLRPLAAGAPESLRPDAMLSLAEVLHEKGDPRGAARTLDDLLAQFPESDVVPAATVRRARLWFDEGDYVRALKLFEELERSAGAPKDEVAYWSAKCLLRSGREERAVDRLRDAASRFADSPLAAAIRYDLAVALARTGDQRGAASTLDAFLEAFPGHPLRPDAMQLAASLSLQLGEHDRALALSGELLRTGEASAHAPAAALLEAETYLLAGRDPEATLAYRALLERYPDHPEAPTASFRLGTLLYNAGDSDGAKPLLERVVDGQQTPELYRPALLLLGDLALRRGDWVRAGEFLEDYTSFGDGASADDALLKLGIARERSGDRTGALTALDQLIADHPESSHAPQARLTRAQILQDSGDIAGAARSLRALVDDPAGAALRPYALLRLAGIAQLQGDHDAAAAYYEDAAASAETDELRLEAAYHRACIAAAAGDFQAAAEGFLRVSAAPDHRRAAEAAARRGIALARLGDTEAALGALDAIFRHETRAVDGELLNAAAYERAWCLRALKRTDDSAAAYRDLLGDAPDGPLAAYASIDLAELLLEEGKPDEAVPLLRRVHDAAAEDASQVPAELATRAAYRLGAEALRMGQFEEAVRLLSPVAASEIRGENKAIVVSAGLMCSEAQSKLGRHARAIERLEAVLAQDPDDASRSAALLRLGDARGSVQQWKESGQAFATHLELFPESELWFQARFGLGWALENQGRYDDAMAEYHAVIDRHSGQTAARAQFQIGECLFAMERHEEAARELLKVDILYAYPEWSAAALYEAGRCFEAMSDPVAAREQFELVRQRFPDTRWAKLAIQRLEMTRAEPVPGR